MHGIWAVLNGLYIQRASCLPWCGCRSPPAGCEHLDNAPKYPLLPGLDRKQNQDRQSSNLKTSFGLWLRLSGSEGRQVQFEFVLHHQFRFDDHQKPPTWILPFQLDGLVDSQLVFPLRRLCLVDSAFCRVEFGFMFSQAIPIHRAQDCWKSAFFSFGSNMSASAYPMTFSRWPWAGPSLLRITLPNYTPKSTLWIHHFWDKTANLDLLSAWSLPLWVKSSWRIFARWTVGL